MLFDPTTYRCNSRHYNLIAFHIDVGLLLRVLRAASSNNTDTLEVKLSHSVQLRYPRPYHGLGRPLSDTLNSFVRYLLQNPAPESTVLH